MAIRKKAGDPPKKRRVKTVTKGYSGLGGDYKRTTKTTPKRTVTKTKQMDSNGKSWNKNKTVTNTKTGKSKHTVKFNSGYVLVEKQKGTGSKWKAKERVNPAKRIVWNAKKKKGR